MRDRGELAMLRVPWCPTASVLVVVLVIGCGGDEGGDEPAVVPPGSTGQPVASKPAERPAWLSPLESAERFLDNGALDRVAEQLGVAEKSLAEATDSKRVAEARVQLKELKLQLASAREAELERQAEDASRQQTVKRPLVFGRHQQERRHHFWFTVD